MLCKKGAFVKNDTCGDYCDELPAVWHVFISASLMDLIMNEPLRVEQQEIGQ